MATARHLVVVASAEPSTTDALADLLRDACTVRTAYDVDEVLDRLDGEVDVVLVDPDLSEDPIGTVRAAITARDLDCLVGALTEADRSDPGIDAVVPLSAADEAVRERVEWLGARARYRKTLDEYYDTVRTAAEAADRDGLAADRDGPGTDRDGATTDRDRIRTQLDRLERRLDDVASALATETLFETVLDDVDDVDADDEDRDP